MSDLPKELLEILKCVNCDSGLDYNSAENTLECKKCNSKFPVKNGIPSLIKGGVEDQEWNPWRFDKVKKMGDSYYKRATGELPEKEASKSYARLLKEKYYKKGDKILDIGCATGHFLKSFRRITDPEIDYVGIDINPSYLTWGAEIFGVDKTCNFVHCDTLNLPFKDNSFDTVVANLFHMFPKVDDVIKESLRVGKKIIWRTPLSTANYVIKEIYDTSFKDVGVITPESENFIYCLYMIYQKDYITGLIESLGGKVTLIERDEDFGEFDNNELEEMEGIVATKVINKMQLHGSFILDWHYVVIEKQKQ